MNQYNGDYYWLKQNMQILKLDHKMLILSLSHKPILGMQKLVFL